jgi:hypothetical protein
LAEPTCALATKSHSLPGWFSPTKPNPILHEVWDTKDRLAAEAGYDVDHFVNQLKEWTAKHPPTGPVVRNAEELRQLIAAKERQRAGQPTVALNEEPTKQDAR